MSVSSFVSDIFDGSGAYIYLWASKKGRCVYVGQTAGASGVLGRAHGHVLADGTLRARVVECRGFNLEYVDDWWLYTFSLPKEKKYTAAEGSFRRAVEYLVQSGLHGIRSEMDPPFQIVSTVTYSDHCSLKSVTSIANAIVSQFRAEYSSI